MSELQKIEKIAEGIMAEYYGTKQDCGTEYQKWTYALLQAERILKGDLVINPKTHAYWKDYVQNIIES